MRFSAAFKSIFFGSVLALAATGARAQTVTIVAPGPPAFVGEGGTLAAPGGLTPVTFKVAKTGLGIVNVTYTVTGTTTSGEDYNPVTGIVSLGNSTPIVDVVVYVKRDSKFELNETLLLTLTGANNGFSVVPPACGNCEQTTIVNDDSAPTVSLSMPHALENAGNMIATVTLSNKSYLPVSVDAVTSDGTANAPADYTAVSRLASTANAFVVPADSLSAPLPIPIVNDALDEFNETLNLTLSNPVNATIIPGPTITLNRTIYSDAADLPPSVSMSTADIFVAEGPNPPTTPVVFTATLSGPSGKTVTVLASTAAGSAPSATTPSDYSGATVVLTFSPGDLSKTFTVVVNGDGALEPDENLLVNFTPQSNVTAGPDTQAQLTIQNDDSPALSINDPIPADEDLPGTLTFRVSIPSPAPVGGVGFTYEAMSTGCVPGCTATPGAGPGFGPGEDYLAAGPMLGGIAAGQTFVDITIPVNPDTDPEPGETFRVVLSLPTGAGTTILDNSGTGTIANDDTVPLGDLVISEFRLSGPGGIADEFIEVANATTADITVFTADGTSGYGVVNNDGSGGTLVFTIPNGTLIPAGGHYLATGSTYSLSNFGGPGAAAGDATIPFNIPDNSGLAIFASASAFTALNRIDSVGFGSFDAGTLFVEPAMCAFGPACGLPNGGTPSGGQYSFVRKYAYGGGTLQDEDLPGTGSKEDFVLVAVNAGTYGGTQSVLGGPSPENQASETERSADFTIASPDGGYQIYQPGMAGVAPKVMEFRRTFTNNVANTTALRFKITNLTAVNSGLGAGVLELRPVTSSAFTGPSATLYHGVTLEGNPDIPGEPLSYTVTTPPGVSPVSGAGTAKNGGLNSTLRLDLTAAGYSPNLPLGTPVGVNFRSEYRETGSFYYWVAVQAK